MRETQKALSKIFIDFAIKTYYYDINIYFLQ